MKLQKFILIVVLTVFALHPVCFAADESLQAAILTQEMMMDIGKNGLSVLGKFADARNIAVLQKVAAGGGEMADVAERTLKILNAYNDGVRGDELKEMVTLEIGDYAYSKIKSKTMDYIKEHVTSVGQLTAAYDLLGTLHDSSYYIVYIGMSIGLDMMDPETVRKLEQSKFTKAAEKITELTGKVMSDAKAGAEEIKEKFLAETEGSFLDKFASSVTGWTSKIWSDAKAGAKDLGGRLWHLVSGPDDDPKETDPSGDDVVSSADSPSGDQVVSGEKDESAAGESVRQEQDGSTPAGDFFTSLPGERDPKSDGEVCYPEDDSGADGDSTSAPQDPEKPDIRDMFGGLSGQFSPDFQEFMKDFYDKNAIVGPNFPHYRMLWLFAGESLTDQAESLLRNPSSIFDSMGDYLSDMKDALQTITGIGN